MLSDTGDESPSLQPFNVARWAAGRSPRRTYGDGDKLTGWYRLGISEELRVVPAKK